MSPIDLSTVSTARDALTTVQATRDRISRELGVIGAAQSRLEVAIRDLRVSRDNSLKAHSQIVDVDVADASASLTRADIMRNITAAILGQANQQPKVALQLLS